MEKTLETFKKAVYKNLPKAQNADVEDFNKFLGITPKHPAEQYQEKIASNVEKATTRKENSITMAAIRRDSVLFSVAEFGPYLGEDLRETKLVELLDKWTLFFETRYGEQHD